MTHSFFALRRRAIIILVLVLGLVLAACSGAEESDAGATQAAATEAPPNGGGGAAEVTDGAVEITTENMVFSTDTITAPAGEDFTVTLTNNDTVPHNFSVYTEQGGDVIAQGDVVTAGLTTEIDISALEPGEYFFVCDLHPEMTGTLVVEG